MFNSQMPSLDELPTSRQLVRSTILAAAGAGALLVAVVLPSEYGVDPTGIGRVLGLTEMGEIKMQLAAEADADAAMDAQASATAQAAPADPVVATGLAPAGATPAAPANVVAGARTDEMSVSLAPGEGAEIKVTAAQGTRIAFDWSVAGGHVNYDTHADAPGISYHGYGKGRESTGERGDLVAAFDGNHGWFWRNRSGTPVTVTLRTEGVYTAIKRVV
jgi:hypothetical protein